MKRRLFSLFLLTVLLLGMTLPVLATETTEASQTQATEETAGKKDYSTDTSGSCGKDITWKLEGHTLTLTGSGAMDSGSPWEFYKDTIYTLILDGEITSIADEAFSSCNNLQYIDFGSSLKEIGYKAFFSCNALEAFRLPSTFRKFGQECFLDCDSLQVIFFDGPMPSFRANCLYTNHTVQLIYTLDNPWPQSEIDRLLSNFGARLYVDHGTAAVLEEYLEDMDRPAPTAAAQETQPAQAAEETTEPTVSQVDLTALMVTEAATVPVETLPAETAVPETAPATTEAETLPPATEPAATEAPIPVTVPQTQPEAQERHPSETVLWVLVAAAIITAILVLTLLIRMVLHSGGRYDD